MRMYNWSTDTSTMSSSEKEIFELEQLINYGLNGNKLSRSLLIKHFDKLQIDEDRKKTLSFLLYGDSHQ